jgi:hypothetical protein
MADPTPYLMTEAEFNQKIKDWSIQTRNKIRRNAPTGTDNLPDNEKLSFTQASVRKNYGTADKITFKFERHGVFVHYGVGRGYVRQGNQVVKGRKLNEGERTEKLKKGYTRKTVAKMKYADDVSGQIKRTPVDWFDVEIRVGIKKLADIAQEFYGDKVLEKILSQIDKAVIHKPNG